MAENSPNQDERKEPPKFGWRLWIDGVGCWLLWRNQELCIGNGSPNSPSESRFRILSDLQTRHGLWRRHQGENWFSPLAATSLNGRALEQENPLRNGDEIRLGSSVLLGFRIPSPLSPSAVFTIRSSHRSNDLFDGIVLFDQTCLLGNGEQDHIRCLDWKERLILFETEAGFWSKRENEIGQPQRLASGDLIETPEGRVRIESW